MLYHYLRRSRHFVTPCRTYSTMSNYYSSLPSSATPSSRSDFPKPAKRLAERRSVRIPDLFSSIMASKPIVNPNYFKARAESNRWITKVMKMDEKTSARNVGMDFCYLMSIRAPDADEEALKMITNWVQWVFYFDDQFDEGHLRDDPAAAEEEIDKTTAIMDEAAPLVTPTENPIRHIFQTCWLQFKQRASPELQQRYKVENKRFCDGILLQVQQLARGEILSRDVPTYLSDRRGSVGVYPAVPIVEYAHDIKLP
ncbi:isoprenoid synthase domain-containing protein [Hypoxylon trugodes]|uniref:isoprenoid synthase domain-containing protein n=1 Tax=Hypoxylon trugodes TaxID=326681 RepID=UPI0021A0DB0F|nr:isoprenoid synthase domain-containing protein [Hypoxylon trugodes]KAI1386076.1 isoprenoid synthase domain-containing protein [Hypoxylon trugodes]